MKVIAIIVFLLWIPLLHNKGLAQLSGDYCFRDAKRLITKIRIQNNYKFEYHTLFSEHGYEEYIEKGIYQLKNGSIKFYIKEQFVNTDTLVAHFIEPYTLAGYITKNEIRIGEKDSFLPYKKCTCRAYQRAIKRWLKLRKRNN